MRGYFADVTAAENDGEWTQGASREKKVTDHSRVLDLIKVAWDVGQTEADI